MQDKILEQKDLTICEKNVKVEFAFKKPTNANNRRNN